MQTKQKVVLLVIILAAAVIIALKSPFFRAAFGRNDRIVFHMNADSSSDIHYNYELSRDDILRVADHYSARHALSCVPGYSEVWEFEIIGDGEVTINWTGYENGVANEEMSFYETFLINNKEHTKIFDSRDEG